MAILKRPLALFIIAVVTAALVLALMASLGGPSSAPSPAQAAKQRVHKVKKGKQHRSSKRQDATSSQAATDPDEPAGGGESESQSPEPAGEAQPGHEDPPGQNVDHRCPPDCAPGELP
jgi:hypothetical protein